MDSKSTYFPYRWRYRLTPWPLASDLWTPRHRITTTTTTTMADYCLCLCVLQLTHLVVECESQQQFDLIIGPHKRFWFPCTSHFHYLLVVFGFSGYCLFAYSVQALCTFTWPPWFVILVTDWGTSYSTSCRLFEWKDLMLARVEVESEYINTCPDPLTWLEIRADHMVLDLLLIYFVVLSPTCPFNPLSTMVLLFYSSYFYS